MYVFSKSYICTLYFISHLRHLHASYVSDSICPSEIEWDLTNGPLDIKYSGLGVRSLGPVGDFLDSGSWTIARQSWCFLKAHFSNHLFGSYKNNTNKHHEHPKPMENTGFGHVKSQVIYHKTPLNVYVFGAHGRWMVDLYGKLVGKYTKDQSFWGTSSYLESIGLIDIIWNTRWWFQIISNIIYYHPI